MAVVQRLPTRAGVEPRAYENPLQGPHGETLAADAAWVGPDDAG
jgi:hypothetical protein